LGAKFFSHRSPRGVPDGCGQVRSENGLEGRDRQQALVLGALRRAGGAPVSYAELRQVGVELPASVVSELALEGVAIERCVSDPGGAVGVRLDPTNDPGVRPMPDPVACPSMPAESEPEAAWSSVRTYRASSLGGVFPTVKSWLLGLFGEGPGIAHDRGAGRGRRAAARPDVGAETKRHRVRERPFEANARSRVLAVTAVLAGIVVVSSLVALWASGSHRATRVTIAKRSQPRVVAARRKSPPVWAGSSAHPAPARAPAVPVSAGIATELEAQGHGLLADGRYGDAVPVLKRAVLATGETLGACLEPASTKCLTYAYALYDLGRAVRLSGQPQEAVPILERRLQIDNQRSVVVAQLQLAREGIG
jgi:hypothetical protein